MEKYACFKINRRIRLRKYRLKFLIIQCNECRERENEIIVLESLCTLSNVICIQPIVLKQIDMVAFAKNNYFGVTFSNSLLMVPHRMLQLCQRVFFVIFATPSRFPSFSSMICVRTLFILLLLSGMTVKTCFKISVFHKFGSFIFLMFNSISHSKRNLISLHTHVSFFKCCTSHDSCTFY